MSLLRKKRIVEFLLSALGMLSTIIALWCLIISMHNIQLFNISKFNLFAVKAILPNPIFYNENTISPNAEIKMSKNDGNQNFKSSLIDETENQKITNSEQINNNTEEDIEEEHSPNEKTYKIIESQFTASGIKFENFYIKNTTGIDIDIASEINKKPEIDIKDTTSPQVLIYHTHTSESYMKYDQGFFYESFYPRTKNKSKNVTKVGESITNMLIQNGINAIHDTTIHDDPTYKGSYSRSEKTVKDILEKYPSIQVTIDIHRDSLGNRESGKIKPTFTYDNKKAAQIMIISGCDTDGSLGFPNWEKNLRLTLRLQKYCQNMFPGLVRPLHFSRVKYNMNLTTGSMLIEVGSDVNTINEATYSGELLGQALSKLLNDLKN